MLRNRREEESWRRDPSEENQYRNFTGLTQLLNQQVQHLSVDKGEPKKDTYFNINGLNWIWEKKVESFN